jgi:hypothetical protein
MKIETLSHTNNTSNFQVVGNKSVVVAEFATVGEANAVVESVNICDSEWGTLDVVVPRQTVTGTFTTPDPISSDDADSDPFGVLSK